MWMRFLLSEGSWSAFADIESVAGSLNEDANIAKYFPSAVVLPTDWITFFNIHCLQFYPQISFSHRVDVSSGVYGQTWTFLGVHCKTTELRRLWKLVRSSFFTEVGSGRSRPAEKAALAIAS